MCAERTSVLNLLICGAMRSGTTSLVRYLDAHPDIIFVDKQKVLFEALPANSFPFANPSLALSGMGAAPNEWIRAMGDYAGKAQYLADKQAYYMFYPHIPFNLKEHLPDIKLIFILRNPVEIGYSAFHHGRQYYAGYADFADYVKQAAEKVAEASDWRQRMSWGSLGQTPHLPLLIERGFYYPQLVRFFHLFSRRQILVLSFEELVQYPHRTVAKAIKFLNLAWEDNLKGIGKIWNAAPHHPPMPGKIRDMLQALYAESNRKVLQLLEWPSTLWDPPS